MVFLSPHSCILISRPRYQCPSDNSEMEINTGPHTSSKQEKVKS